MDSFALEDLESIVLESLNSSQNVVLVGILPANLHYSFFSVSAFLPFIILVMADSDI